ncbi:hypothetical protein RM533_03585 [Croceicoccus sp. F390]|uniref:Argininosuccinate lyase n=1 Tax=Croceicoccus esteveae TaxID=3075597 RepID=A0ABU2ZF88_9SPHN|nr:hypothetical protein [Croceicoccus sp. F390]MDT0575262.1 hypothetical protein [Croceicoccus sp. F390]
MRKFAIFAVGGVLALGLSACDVEKTQDGELPEVDVEAGQLPEYNVDTADVDVTTEERVVEVPVIETEPADASTVD